MASVVFAISSALCLYISSKITNIHEYLSANRLEANKQKEILTGFVTGETTKWFIIFALLIISCTGGVVLLIISIS